MKEDRVKQSIGDKDGEYSRDLAMEIFESLLTEDGASIVVTARIADDNKSITYTEMDTNGDFVEEVEFEKKM
jgi:molybdopterin biosynthesis enzyme MoaB